MVWKADNVWVQNLTACNFLGGAGDGQRDLVERRRRSGKIGGHGYSRRVPDRDQHLLRPQGREIAAAEYGMFSSNWSGGTWDQTYASNFNDSGYYIGACQQVCNQTINHAWAEFNALGYSGSNSGGRLVVENSEFDNNEDGFDTNSQNGDNPPPQNGACPNSGISPITHTHSCWVFMHNYVHDNNNPNVPALGSAAAGPVGTGMSVSGGRNDTIMDNRFVEQQRLGRRSSCRYPDSGAAVHRRHHESPILGKGSCLFDEYGDARDRTTRSAHNGFYGNPTNGDFDRLNFETHPTDCFSGNTDTSGALTAGVGAPAGDVPDVHRRRR